MSGLAWRQTSSPPNPLSSTVLKAERESFSGQPRCVHAVPPRVVDRNVDKFALYVVNRYDGGKGPAWTKGGFPIATSTGDPAADLLQEQREAISAQLMIAAGGTELSQRRFASRTGIAHSDNRSLIPGEVNILRVPRHGFCETRAQGIAARRNLGFTYGFSIRLQPALHIANNQELMGSRLYADEHESG
jgi:hypothetical protein